MISKQAPISANTFLFLAMRPLFLSEQLLLSENRKKTLVGERKMQA
jgi:hypothetical protein